MSGQQDYQNILRDAIDFTRFTPLQAQRLAAVIGRDPSSIPIRCEAPGCEVVAALKDMHSVAAIWRHTRGIEPFWCGDEQHWGCTPEHAAAAMIVCLNEHILPAHQQAVAARDAMEAEQAARVAAHAPRLVAEQGGEEA